MLLSHCESTMSRSTLPIPDDVLEFFATHDMELSSGEETTDYPD